MASATNGNGNNNNNNASSGPAPRKGGGGAKKKAGGGASGKKPFKKQQSNPTLRPKPAKGTAGGARSKTRPPSESEDEDHAPLQRVVPAAPPQQDSLPARSILDDMDLFGEVAEVDFRN